MVFSSITFLFLFLPIVLFIYHGLFFLPITLGSQRRIFWHLSNAFLLFISLLFYYWGEGWRVWIFVGTTLLDFLTALLISRALFNPHFEVLKPDTKRLPWQKVVLIFSVCGNLLILAYFKYFNFLIESLNSLSATFHLPLAPVQLHSIILPLGISFFTFHSMSYTIDVYRGHIRPTCNFFDYACYVLMFPQLVAGPIVRFSFVSESLVKRRVTLDSFASGVSRFVLGLGKKVLIANNVAAIADPIFSLPQSQLSPALAWMGATSYMLQIYFDFSGYSDMAIGLGRMLGFELPENFNFPYVARSVRDFWHRWHMSLSTWFQDYVYIPLGGSRVSPLRVYFNLLLVFVLCGLWHGASWTFVIWGLYHGVFLILERQPFVRKVLDKTPIFSHLYVLLIVLGGWIMFRADTFSQAFGFYRAMLGFSNAQSAYAVQWYAQPDTVIAFLIGVIFCAPRLQNFTDFLQQFVSTLNSPLKKICTYGISGMRVICLTMLLVVSAMSLASGTHNPFIYFRF